MKRKSSKKDDMQIIMTEVTFRCGKCGKAMTVCKLAKGETVHTTPKWTCRHCGYIFDVNNPYPKDEKPYPCLRCDSKSIIYFCQNYETDNTEWSIWQVRCENCGMSSGLHWCKEGATHGWNQWIEVAGRKRLSG